MANGRDRRVVTQRPGELSDTPGDVFGVQVQLSRTPSEKTINIHVLNPAVFEVLPARNLAAFETWRDWFVEYMKGRYPDHRAVVKTSPPRFVD